MSVKIISRAEAKAAGLKRYFTGESCPRAHIAERLVANRACAQCLSEKRHADRERERKVNGRKVNRGRGRKVNRGRDLERERKVNLEKARKWRAANPELKRKQCRESAQRRRTEKRCEEVSARIDRGKVTAEAGNRLLDLHTAIDIFRADHDAFDFLGES